MNSYLSAFVASVFFLLNAGASAQTTHINPRGEAGDSGYIVGCMISAWIFKVPACGEFPWARQPSDTNSFILPPGGGVLAPQGGGGAPGDRGFFGWLEDICNQVPCEDR